VRGRALPPGGVLCYDFVTAGDTISAAALGAPASGLTLPQEA